MNLTSRMTRRVGATAVAVCAAIAVPAVALAAPGSSAAPTVAAAARTALPGCVVADLTVWAGVPADGSAGAFHYQLEISNTSRHACTLYGYPGVSALGPHGHQVGSAAIRNAAHPKTLVTLAPGATSHVELQINDVANFPASACHPVSASGLRVIPPNDRRSEVVPLSFEACSKRGPKFLSVTTTKGGTGIPGYTS